MPTIAALDAAGPGAAALARLRRLARRLPILVAICVSVALLLTALDRGGFGVKLVYSLAVGSCCWALTEALRLATSQVLARLRRARGLPEPADVRVGFMATQPLLVMAMVVGVPLGLAIGDLLTGQRAPSLLAWDSTSTRLTLVTSVIASVVMMALLVMLERLADARAQAEAALRLASENQLRLLQAQLEPHMLFNTLANLRVLIALDPPRAQAMLDRLIAFLRTTLAASRQGDHALSSEFEHLRDYLELMSMRMGPRLAVAFDLPAELRDARVPALLLQPLVENAIRHGLEPKVAGGRLSIGAAHEAAQLVLSVRDTGVGLGTPPAPGGSLFGLEQMRRRLATLYGAAASLSLEPAGDAEGGTLATVKLPLPLPLPVAVSR